MELSRNLMLPQAIAAFQESVRLDPSLPEAHGHLGTALMCVGDINGALRAFKAGRARDPAHRCPDLTVNYAAALHLSGNLHAARELLEHHLTIHGATTDPEVRVVHSRQRFCPDQLRARFVTQAPGSPLPPYPMFLP